MSGVRTLVVCSADCVSTDKFVSVEKLFADHESISLVQSSPVLLNEDQQQTLPVQNVSAFCRGAVAACLLDSEQAIDFAAIKKSLKLSDDEMYHTADPFFVTKLSRFMFPHKQALEQTVVVCSPPLAEQHRDAILDKLRLNGVFVLSHQEIACRDQPILGEALPGDDDQEQTDTSCTVVLCEGIGVVEEITLSIGCQDDDDELSQMSQKYAPASWRAIYSEHRYQFAQIVDAERIETLFPALPTERTLALIKPTAVSKGFVGDIVDAMECHGFTVISRKRVHLKAEHAQHFYKEHEGKAFFEGLTAFMSSGPIHAFILERSRAIKCWRTLLGPTNTFTAKEEAPRSLRAQFGTDQTANACHGSDSVTSAEREIRFYFPEIGMVLEDEDRQRAVKGNVVEEYMAQTLGNNETLKEFLIRGLSELAKQKPGSKLEVVEWFGHWLLDNNPRRPKIDEPNEVEPEEVATGSELAE